MMRQYMILLAWLGTYTSNSKSLCVSDTDTVLVVGDNTLRLKDLVAAINLVLVMITEPSAKTYS